MKHRHHIEPRHNGGSDDPSNLVLLSVEDHAHAHKLLYEQYGREEDFIAWRGLAGIIGKEEIVHELHRLGGRRSGANWKRNTRVQKLAEEYAWKEVAREKRSRTFLQNGHQQGHKNSAFETSIYRDEVGNRARYKRGSEPEGWILSALWVENRKNKKNNTYGKRWYNDGTKNFLLSPTDAKTESLNLGRLNPGFR